MSTESYQLAQRIGEILADKKGQDIVLLDVRQITLVTDYFVLATGTSSTNLQALSDAVISTLKEEDGVKPLSQEGMNQGNWVLIDCESVIVHIFLEETRNFYNLERLWAEAEEIPLSS